MHSTSGADEGGDNASHEDDEDDEGAGDDEDSLMAGDSSEGDVPFCGMK